MGTSSRRHRNRTGLIIVAILGLLAVPARAEDPLDPYLGDVAVAYPNLVPNVALVDVRTTRELDDFNTEDGMFLFFDTRAQNMGTVPIQVTIDEVETPETSTVSQCVSWRSVHPHVCSETELVGNYTWHDEHRHFHYEDFASYELRGLTAGGRADYSDAGLLRVSSKVSFCFYDLEKVDDNAFPVGSYTEANCAAPVVMGVSPGWTDIYGDRLPGQNLDIAGLPNGRYALTTHINYEGTLRETTRDDNFVEVIVEISDSDDPFIHPSGRKAEIITKYWPTPAERVAPPTTTTTTTTTLPGTTGTTGPPGGLLPGARIVSARPAGSAPVVRRRPPPPRSGECPLWERSCTRSWATAP